MSATTPADVDAIARAAGLSPEQTVEFGNTAASWAMEGLDLTPEVMRLGAEMIAGRMDFATARAALGV